MKVQVKICGIKTVKEALDAVEAGADFIGINFVPSSKRRISISTGVEIVTAVRNKVAVVGVFQDAPFNLVSTISEQLKLDYVQIHGKETVNYCRRLSTKIIKVFSLDSEFLSGKLTKEMEKYQVAYFLLDRKIQSKGPILNSANAGKIARKFSIFLAGGLNPDNIAKIIEFVKPFAVDVVSGVETDGSIDAAKVKKFIKLAKKVIY